MQIPEAVLDRNWDTMSASEQRAFVAGNGFIVVPQALSNAELDKIMGEIEYFDLEKNVRDGTEAFCSAPSFTSVLDNPKILSTVKNIIGDNVVCFKADYVAKKSFDRARVEPQRTALHVDYGIGEREGDYRNTSAVWVNVACYLTDMTIEHAPFAVVPGSHRMYHLVPGTDMEELKDDAVTLMAKAGDAVIFLHSTVHAGGVNVSGSTQHIVFCSFRPAWARPIGPVIEWPAEFVSKAPAARQQLLSGVNQGLYPQKNKPQSMLGRFRELFR